jgi:hypothetical protein
MSKSNEAILIDHFTAWIDKKGNIVDEKYLMTDSIGLNLIRKLCGFNHKSVDEKNKIINKFIKNDTFFKLYKFGHYNLEDGTQLNSYLSLFQLLLFGLKKIKLQYNYILCFINNILRDILKLTEHLVKLSEMSIEGIDYRTLFLKFKQSGILDYISSYHVIFNENLDGEFNLFDEVSIEEHRIQKIVNDTKYGIFDGKDEKEEYKKILSNLKTFCDNIRVKIFEQEAAKEIITLIPKSRSISRSISNKSKSNKSNKSVRKAKKRSIMHKIKKIFSRFSRKKSK